MDATRHPVRWTAGFSLLLGTLLLAVPGTTIAQGPAPRRVTPKTTGRPASKSAAQRAGAPKRLPRSRLQSSDLRVQKLDPKLKAALLKWELATSRIKTLKGEIYRYHREFVFNTEKRARGMFYYESPDKGRLDIYAAQIPKGTISSVKQPARRDPRTGKVTPARKVPLAVSGDNPEK